MAAVNFSPPPESRFLSPVTTNSPPQNHLKMASLSLAGLKRLLFSSLLLRRHSGGAGDIIYSLPTDLCSLFAAKQPQRLPFDHAERLIMILRPPPPPLRASEASSLLDTVKGLTQLRPGRMHCVRGWRFDGSISGLFQCVQNPLTSMSHQHNQKY